MSQTLVYIASIIILLGSHIMGTETNHQNIIDPELVEKIELLVSEGNLPSLQAAVIKKDKIVWSQAFGQNANLEQVYMIGSVQKVFEATAILQLYEKGLINLDADINSYLPFLVRHPEYPDLPITTRMIVSHRSGLKNFNYHFAWDTECLGYPEYRHTCNEELLLLSLGEYLRESLSVDGANYSPNSWGAKPNEEYYYSVGGYTLLKYLIEQVSGQSYAEYMRDNIFAPLQMDNAGCYIADFEGRHAIPFTRIENDNIELPLWEGSSAFMRMTAEDLAKFQLALMNNGRYNDYQLLQPETIKLMRKITTARKSLFNLGSKLYNADYGLGIRHFEDGWMGLGGSVPGYICIWRFNPDRQAGYAFLSNINSILKGGNINQSITESYASLQGLLENKLNPPLLFNISRSSKIAIGPVLVIIIAIIIHRRKRSR